MRPLLALLTVFLLPGVPMGAQEAPATDPFAIPPAGPAIDRPASARPAWNISRQTEAFDGVELSLLVLKASGFAITSEFPRGYKLVEGNPAYSVLFEHQVDPDLRWGFAQFRDDEFLPDLDTRHLESYARSLLHKNPPGRTVEFLTTPRKSQQTNSAAFLGTFPRALVYEVTDTINKQQLRVAEYFFERNGDLLVLRVEAPPDRFDARLRQILYTVNLMNIES